MQKRYAEFDELRKQLLKVHQRALKPLPFPSKTSLGSLTSTSESTVAKRRSELGIWVCAITSVMRA